jgi:hypothetical protein
MAKSDRLQKLETELRRVKKSFLPKLRPTGDYSERKLAHTIAYRILAHAEIEAYLEDIVWEAALSAKRKWDESRTASRTIVCLLAFSGQAMEPPPSELIPRRGSRRHPPERISVDEKITNAVNSFRVVKDQNHGLKEANLLALLLPIGVSSEDLEPEWLAMMNTFGQQRGIVAHSSADSYRTQQPPDPANELERIKQICLGLETIDALIEQLN